MDHTLHMELARQGFVKIPFWHPETVNTVRDTFFSEFAPLHFSDKAFHTTYETKNRALIEEVNRFLQPFYEKISSGLLGNMAPIGASFLVKSPGEGSESPFHQDASFVLPPENSLSVWVALEDADEHNGCLQFVPGSHRLFPQVRYMPYSNNHLEPFEPLLAKYVTRHSIKAGEAFIFYNSTVHASPHNHSPNSRLACVMTFYPKDAQLSLFERKDNQIHRFSVTPDALRDINDRLEATETNTLQSLPLPTYPDLNEARLFFGEKRSLRQQLFSIFKL